MKVWTVDDVMTATVVVAAENTPYRDVVDLLMDNRVDAVPVVDDLHRVRGVVSDADLLHKIERPGHEGGPRLFESRRRRTELSKAAARTAAGLMTSPAITVPSGTPVAAAARLMDAEGVKRLPVVDADGRLAGIVSRTDLLKVHLRPDGDIQRDVREALRGVLPAEKDEIEVRVSAGTVRLTGRLALRSTTRTAVRVAWLIAGVAGVADELAYEFDDRDPD